MRDVAFLVRLSEGATGLPSPGDIVRTSRLISRNETKRSCYRPNREPALYRHLK